jgi:hypothetical protein
MWEDVCYCVKVGDFDEIGIGMDAVVEAVEVEKEHWLCSVVLEFGEFAGA